MDVWRACKSGTSWGPAESLGPLFNSVHDDWAYFPHSEDASGWLLTGRDAAFGGSQIWEVRPDGPPEAPVLLSTRWEVSGDVVPGTLTLSDAESDVPLAELELSESSGQWDLVVGSGQVVRYSFQTHSGKIMEGTYAVPEVSEASSVSQRMVMSTVDGKPYLEARPLTREGQLNPNLTWNWNVVTEEVVVPELKPWDAPETAEEAEEVVHAEARPIKQFTSYPWWTEVQKEERALAANVLSSYLPDEEWPVVRPSDHSNVDGYAEALSEVRQEVLSRAADAVLALASSQVLLLETPWEEALTASMRRAEELWPVGTINAEEVARQAQRRWASIGTLYDQGLLPDVRDKRALVGDGEWVESPWKRGDVAAMARRLAGREVPRREALNVVWSLAHQPDATEVWGEAWLNPEMWDVAAVSNEWAEWEHAHSGTLTNDDSERWKSTLNQVRTRMSVLDAMETTKVWTEEMREAELRRWAVVAMRMSDRLNPESEIHGESTADSIPTSEPGNEAGKESDNNPSNRESSETWEAMARKGEKSLEQALREEWREVWSTWKVQEEATTSSTGEALKKVTVEWSEELENWVSRAWKEHDLPQEFMAAAQRHWEGSSREANEGQDGPERPFQRTWFDSRPGGMQRLSDQAEVSMEAEEAKDMLVSVWLVARWLHSSDWTDRTPDEMLALTDRWHPSVKAELEAMSTSWAKTEQAVDSPASATAEAFEPLVDSEESVAVNSADAVSSPANLHLGDRGLHLGWFRNAPNVDALPAGTHLVSEAGKQGLSRWVLVLPAQGSDLGMEEVLGWLSRVGVSDAHELHWHGDAWKKEPVREVLEVEDVSEVPEVREVDSQSLPPNPSHSTDTTDETDASNPSEASQSDPVLAEENGQVESSSSLQPDGTRAPGNLDVAKWGNDDVWEHGAPVELGQLLGTWYAVQVGAFRGIPQKEWIEMAGERLVYEPFPDGLARWYAGVRQDEASARKRWEELKAFPPFADAFVVRLRNGEREVIRPGESLDNAPENATSAAASAAAASAATATMEGTAKEALAVPSNSSGAGGATNDPPVEAMGSSGQEEGRTVGRANAVNDGESRKTDSVVEPEDVTMNRESVPSSEVGASLSKPKASRPASWHVDISKYYGTVPSKDVAALLIRAADWGVRSVELFGQTIYSSRSCTDLSEAERILAEVRREGFSHAQLVKEE